MESHTVDTLSAYTDQDVSMSTKQETELAFKQAVQTFKLMTARAKAETAELKKRLIMQDFRPCKLYPIILHHDGLRWVCEYVSMRNQFHEYEGADAVAYGMSPEEAMQNFDKLWIGATEDELEDELEDEESGDADI